MTNIIIGISAGVGGVFVILVVVVVILWCLKSKRREKERFERTASIRSSLNNLNKINSSLRGTKSTLSMLSEGHSRRRLDQLDDRSVVSSVAKHSQSSANSNGMNGSTYSINSGYGVDPYPVSDRRDYDRRDNEKRNNERRDNDGRENDRRDNGRPIHSLRPDRNAGPLKRVNRQEETNKDRGDEDERERERQREAERQKRRRREEQEREEEENQRRRQREPQGRRAEPEEESDDDSINKRGLDDSDFDDDDDGSFDTEFDEDEDDNRGNDDVNSKNMHYNIHRSHEKLMERSPTDDERDYKPPRDKAFPRINPSHPSNKPFSSFATPAGELVDRPRPVQRRLENPPELSRSRENLPTPPPDPRQIETPRNANVRSALPSLSSKLPPKPQPKPKPQPPARKDVTYAGRPSQTPEPNQQGYPNHPSAMPRKNNLVGSQDRLYNNDNYLPSPQVYDNDPPPKHDPIYDPVYEGSRAGSKPGSHRGPLYDPVYDGSSNRSQSTTDRYEPINMGQQLPDTDYLPRPLGGPLLARSKEHLGPPPPVPPPLSAAQLQFPLESDIDSYAPSIQSDIDYMPRQFQPNPKLKNVTNAEADALPPKPGMDVSVHPSSQPSLLRGSRDHLNRPTPMAAQPPPYSYSEEPQPPGRRGSRDNLADRPYRGSREHLEDQPPPYSPGSDLMLRRHGGSRDVLYLNQGARPKVQESIETEI